MNGRRLLGICAAVAIAVSFPATSTVGQQKSLKEQLVGTWIAVSFTAVADDGNKTEPFGVDPRGVVIFTSDDHFSLLQTRPDLPKVTANSILKATPEEAMAVMQGSIAYYGMYSVNETDKTFSVRILASTFANMIGPEQKRIITSLTQDELKFTNPRIPAGLTLQTVWKRAPAH
jgi:hypothetical protein